MELWQITYALFAVATYAIGYWLGFKRAHKMMEGKIRYLRADEMLK